MVSPRRLMMTTQHTQPFADRNQTVTQKPRNSLPSFRDRGSVPRSRPWGEPIWISLFGRDWVVKKPTKLGFAGSFMGSLGVVCIVWGSVESFDPLRIGIAMFVAGVILVCFKELKAYLKELRTMNLAADEIYNIGRERGEAETYDEAYKEGYQEGMTHGERRRPHVVAPLPKCPSCGTSTALHSVASVADRV